ncbi:hypothetical protein [Flindersiella endophytica]
MQPANPPDPDFQLLFNAHARWADMPPVKLENERADLHAIVTFLQLASRHPSLSEGQHIELIQIGRRLQAIVCDTPEMLAFTDMGWNPQHDQQPPPEPDGG